MNEVDHDNRIEVDVPHGDVVAGPEAEGEAETENEAPGPYVGVSGKQPNFLQKLYDFMALDPHPCPDVIYWAADSKQLVIAQPDRLAKEILPRLFKHDKISSFGRQLNIYGFSRMFPGRQFKDAEGHVSDASVWSHPTLTRMSAPSEVTAVKRRAAPKLFRTRKLSNGQLIRTRAGPGVEAKFKEIRDEMAGSKRIKAFPIEQDYSSTAHSTGRSYAFTPDEPQNQHVAQRSRIAIIPAQSDSIAPAERVQQYGSLPHINTSIAIPAFRREHRQIQVPHTAMPFWNRGRDSHGSYLESINENAPSSWETGFSGLIESVPVTAAPAQGFATARDPSYRYATASFSGAFGGYPGASPSQPSYPSQQTQAAPRFEPVFQPVMAHHNQNSLEGLQGLSSIAIQSCPASIHTSPVLRAQDRPVFNETSHHGEAAWNASSPMVMPYPAYTSPLPDHFPTFQSQPQHPLSQFESAVRIAHPAAPNPSALNTNVSTDTCPTPASDIPPGVDAYGHRDRLSAALATIADNSSISSFDSISPLNSARPSIGWDQGNTIDPRWVSPSGSAWTTPALTPRTGTPASPPYPQLQQINAQGF